jgi:hypothetical protein
MLRLVFGTVLISTFIPVLNIKVICNFAGRKGTNSNGKETGNKADLLAAIRK